MRRNGLSKYDAPLRIQFEWGYAAFKKGGSFKNVNPKKVRSKKVYVENRPSNMEENTMQYREWQRGWNTAYFENLEKLNGLGTRG